MYAFGPLPRLRQSGRIIGTHQKIDRIARRHLKPYLKPNLVFPSIRDILHFEGLRGPDGIKIKSPGRDEPWHFIDPDHIEDDDRLLVAIRNHRENLTQALAHHNSERAAFEAAWLAHALTDGLTPAHHEPLDEQVKHLRADDHRKDKFRSRVIMSGGGSSRDFVKNNWEYWGAKGIMTTHTLFEGGVASTVKPLSFDEAAPTAEDFAEYKADGFEKFYLERIKRIAALDMYESFRQTGWTRRLANQTKDELMPTILVVVTIAWYDCYQKALEQTS